MINVQHGNQGIAIQVVTERHYDDWLDDQQLQTKNWLTFSGFKTPGYSLIPNSEGESSFVLVVVKDTQEASIWNFANLAVALPAGDYCFSGSPSQQANFALGWALAQYQFDRYLKSDNEQAVLYIENQSSYQQVQDQAEAVFLTRNLINTPAADMMPEHLSQQMQTLAEQYDAEFDELVGEQLLEQNYPTIHMVGRASVHDPRLLQLHWGDEDAPKLTLVGKGICFDSGGLDLKPASGMRLMKKDMGGAAHVLGLAKLIMAAELPVRLRVIVAAAENAVSGNAFRPGDIVKTRKGLTVEIDNTDAEGRLVLCDALAEASDENPDLIIDFATLTGAARVALGLEVPGFYSTDDAFSEQLRVGAIQAEDSIWQLPLHQGYADYMKGSISDLVNASPTPYGGSITAALFLQHFVASDNWVHFDVGAWNDRARPGRPKGGEAMGVRAVFNALEARYC
ncbi:leucyl aminopeptidase family protein [Reinekea thalattae]|uniref:Leucyl aminopeptidase family protein n=1 Tax=Reinekea thalattae TaxID=2593301 RepID=A0A5C8Z4I1_9GAMM|nr:leucyl aminopeptidase family protein [Reinekea thalattae]TXR53005.1 leucyl aminopeptidase family protein [Reinekea thalattae]